MKRLNKIGLATLITLALLTLFWLLFKPITTEGEPLAVVASVEVKTTPKTPAEILIDKGRGQGLSPAKIAEMVATVKCESNYQNIQSRIMRAGAREDSWGIAQIHLPDHPQVTKAQALDIEFAATFMAKEFAAGHERNWTCWRNIYGK